MRTSLPLLLLLSPLAIAQTDDFENGNPNGWSFDGFPNSIEATGGNPDGHLYDDDICANCGPAPNPTLLPAPGSAFSGDLRAAAIERIGMDMLQVQGASPFGAMICVVIGQSAGQPGILDDCLIWKETGVSLGFGFPSGTWVDVETTIDVNSATIPAGWNTQTLAGSACTAGMSDDEIWESLITNADYVAFHFGRPNGFSFYNGQLRIDNIFMENSLTTVNYCTSSANSTTFPAIISATGNASVAANNLTLSASPVPNQLGLFYFGPDQILAPFGNGFRCVGGTVVRLPIETIAGNQLVTVVDNSTPPVAGQIVGGAVLNFQAWFRDPAAGGANFDLSDGVQISFLP